MLSATLPTTAPTAAPAAPPTTGFLDRDLSWLEFNRRVLDLALDKRTPILERVKFLAIFNSNLDEFFMKRVLRLKGRVAAETRVAAEAPSYKQLLRIRETILPMLKAQ